MKSYYANKEKHIFSCYLIGEDSLAYWCAQVIIKRGHKLLGICSSCEKLRNLADTHDIMYTNSIADLKSLLMDESSDFLFSIVNSDILKEDILKLPRYFTINYHNAPLPKYRGVHATSWAILNNEKHHGVTWHIVDLTIDTGDILKQAVFAIDEQDTNFSLDVKCIKYALPLFHELIDELANQKHKRIKQEPGAGKYYSLYNKPKYNGIITWPCSANEISALYRATNFTDHENKLCLPKLIINNCTYLPKEARVVKNTKRQAPGTIVDLSSGELRVTTVSDDVIFSKISCVTGQLSNLDNLNHIKVIQNPKIKFLTTFERCSERLAKHESFWVRTLQQAKDPDFFELQATTQEQIEKVIYINKSFKSKINAILPQNIDAQYAFLTTLIIYLSRLNNYDDFSLGYERVLDEAINESSFFSPVVPLNISLAANSSFCSSLAYTHQLIRLIINKETFAKDIALRYPQLNSYQYISPIVVSIGRSYRTFKNCLHFVIDEEKIVLRSPTSLDELTQKLIDNMPKHLEVLVDSILNTIALPINRLQLLTKQEIKIITEDWNNTKTSFPSDQSLIDIFTQQVIQRPNNIAIKFEGMSLTYNELNNKIKDLGYHLTNMGVANGSLVAIYFDRGINAIVSILSIIKVGAAYVPLDTNHPEQYINNIIEDTKTSIILTQEKNKSTLEKLLRNKNAPTIAIDTLPALSKDNFSYIDVSVKHFNPRGLAYVMYTSGSTGQPKGVMINHRSIVRLVKNTNYIKFSSDQHVAQVASFAFDASTFEIWGALLNGATLVCTSIDIILNPEKFENFLQKEKIDVLLLTTALFNQHASINPAMFKGLQYFLTGGEVLNPNIMHLVANCKNGKPRHFYNAYGPTENATITTTFELSAQLDSNQAVPIGTPIANTTTYVLDKFLNLMPVGVRGELCTGGDGLSLGYLNNYATTKEKFIDTVFMSKKTRLYKTGDKARWLPNGVLGFVGRVDNQVKIRGFRIEPEEIEKCLVNCHAVSQCAVVAKKEKENHIKIIAYVVLQNKSDDIANVRKYLSTKLPSYMVPSIFVTMDKFPLNQSGKIDKESLPTDFKESNAHVDYIPPTTKLEKKVTEIWQKLLAIEEISINDNFFRLGGNSLLITEMVTMIKKEIGIDFPFYEFIENPTIANITGLIETVQNGSKKIDFLSPNNISLDNSIKSVVPSNSLIGITPKALLITGATGFLGAHLLNELCCLTKAKIFCLVREKNIENAYQRLEHVLKEYKLFHAINNRQIQVIVGDIAKLHLGLNQQIYDQLCCEIDVIYHCAAHVNHIYSYDKLYSANVASTLELLKIATTKKDKHIHYISTLSTTTRFLDDNGYLLEDFLDAKKAILDPSDSGYTQTKLMSEIFLSQANKRGIRVSIYRPSWITGHSQTGIFAPQDNHLFLLLKGCIQMWYAPELDINLNLVPVDVVSRIIAQASLSLEKVRDRVFNLASPFTLKWNELINYLNSYGYKIKQISPELWCSNYLSKIGKNNALYRLMSIYATDGGIQWANEQNRLTKVKLDHANTVLATFNLKHMKINNEILNRYFTFLTRSNFMPKINPNETTEKITMTTTNRSKSLTEAVSCLPGNFFWKDKDGHYLGCNKSLLNVLGFKNENEIIGKTDYDLWPEQAETLRINDTNVMEANMQMNFEEMTQVEGKSPIFFAVLKTPLKDDNGNIIGVIGNATNITYRKKLDNEKLALKYKVQNERVNSYLKEISSCMPGNFYWKDLEGKYIGCNKAVLDMMVYSDERELVGKTDYDLWPEQADELRKNDNMVIESNEPVHFEETITVAGCDPMFFAVVKIALRDANNNVVGIIGNSLDITYRKETEKLRTETAVQKAQLDEQKKFRVIVDQVVHDIRSPLASLLMIIKSSNDDIPEHTRIALRNAVTNITDIANNVLNRYEKTETNVLETEKHQPVMVTLVLLQLFSTKKYQYKETDIKFINEFCQKCIFTFIKIQLSAFKRMMSNLINNAIEASEGKKGVVHLELNMDETNVKIVVQDDGKGMSQEMINKITSNEIVGSDKKDGHGIGLNQIRETMAHNQGKLSIDSKLGKGTKIILTFPIIAPPDWIVKEIKINKGDTVVILDDDMSIHEAWDIRLKTHLNELYIKHFIEGNKAIDFINAFPEKEKIFLLTDFELLKQNISGIDVIEKTNIKRSVLVTSHAASIDIHELALKKGIKILPKQLASEVTLEICEADKLCIKVDKPKKLT